jgi:hypothetical protein
MTLNAIYSAMQHYPLDFDIVIKAVKLFSQEEP